MLDRLTRKEALEILALTREMIARPQGRLVEGRWTEAPVKLIENVLDFGDAQDVRVDGISGIYQISHNTICIEF
jgi:hypothetical protein